MRRHSNGHLTHPNAKPFTDFIAERQVMDMADLNVSLMRGIGHERTTRFPEKLRKKTKKTGAIGAMSQDELPVFSFLNSGCANRIG